MEFQVSGKEYGLLAEGDVGKLTFQGTRYLGFERSTSKELREADRWEGRYARK